MSFTDCSGGRGGSSVRRREGGAAHNDGGARATRPGRQAQLPCTQKKSSLAPAPSCQARLASRTPSFCRRCSPCCCWLPALTLQLYRHPTDGTSVERGAAQALWRLTGAGWRANARDRPLSPSPRYIYRRSQRCTSDSRRFLEVLASLAAAAVPLGLARQELSKPIPASHALKSAADC